ncbi:MAG TPA: twin-arginine translocase TatA/TatE family subunit [Bryobacteraceae bacterium]
MEWIIIIVVILLIFGGKKLPGLAKGFGEGIRNFKSGIKSSEENKEKQNPER